MEAQGRWRVEEDDGEVREWGGDCVVIYTVRLSILSTQMGGSSLTLKEAYTFLVSRRTHEDMNTHELCCAV